MNSFKIPDVSASSRAVSHSQRAKFAVAGVAAIALTYATASADLGILGILATAGISGVFAVLCLLPRLKPAEPDPPAAEQGLTTVLDSAGDRLVALDEANEVFGASLNAADMFRLVCSRVREIIPFEAAVLAVYDDAADALRVVQYDGPAAETLMATEPDRTSSIPGRAFASGKTLVESGPADGLKMMDVALLGSIKAVAAIPLFHKERPFGVFQLFLDSEFGKNEDNLKLLEAIGDHVTPIFRSSIAFERTLSSALTDPLTGLPNERAFYMVLENQLAESLRHREERPLSVLSIDIRDFGAVNSMLGHAVGDRMLEFAAARISEQLRKMDFLARTVNDEFNVVLPTASERTAFEIIERIKTAFVENEFEISDGEGVSIALNIGWAAFWQDGETTEQLLRAAQQRKRQAKSEIPANVLWFPKEYVH